MLKLALIVGREEDLRRMKESACKKQIEAGVEGLQERIKLLVEEKSQLQKELIQYEKVKPALKNITELLEFITHTL